MAKLLVCGLALASFVLGTFADPIFLLSSKRINDISRSLFFDSDSFNNLMDEQLLLRESLPNNVIVFDVNLEDKKYVNNPSLILSEMGSHLALQKYFGSSSNTFSSVYVKDALTPEFTENTLKHIQKAGDYHLSQSTLKKFSFDHIKGLKETQGKNVLSVATVPITELSSLNDLFGQLCPNFSQDSHLIILKFTDASNNGIPQALNQLELNERLLQSGDEVANPDNAEADTDTPAAAPTTTASSDTILISSAGLTGFVISLILLVGVYIGFQVMQDIKGPTRFYKDTLQIGKEQ